MGASGSKPPAPTGGAPTGGAPAKPKGDPILQQKFAAWKVEQNSEPGFGADEDDMQDIMLSTSLKGEVSLFALFDGHGVEGKAVSQKCNDSVVEVLGKHMTGENSKDGLKESFKALNEAVCKGDTAESGCSATVVVYDVANKELLIGNVGDSKAVVAKAGASVTSKLLTVDHYPNVPSEKARIVAAGGRVAATDDVQLGELGGQRVWKGATDKPGLPLSRSIGDDIAKEVGVTAEPDVTHLKLSGEDRFLVLASGGVWKVFSPQEVVELIVQQPDLTAACDAVLREAAKRWEELWQGENTSVMIVAFPTA